jgi:hypothetical protein
MASAGNVPFRSVIGIMSQDTALYFPVKSVERFSIEARKNSKWNGLAMGAALDALGIGLMALVYCNRSLFDD